MATKKVYNGVIDWWKIVFCLIIVVMHVESTIMVTHFFLYGEDTALSSSS